MARRSFDDAFWGDGFVQEIDKDAKLLFVYLWTNKRCNSAGLYEITPKTIAFESGIPIDQLPHLFDVLSPKVKWLQPENIVWVKNFLKHQPKSPQFLKSVAACLYAANCNGAVKEFLEYYGKLGVSIPYTYRMDTVSIPYRYILEPELELELELEHTGVVKGDGKETLVEEVKKLKKYPPEFVGLRKQIFAGLKERRGYNSRTPGGEALAMSQMLSEQLTPVQILQAYDLMKTQPFFKDKNLSMMQVRKDIHEVLKNGNNQSGKGNPRKLPTTYTPDGWGDKDAGFGATEAETLPEQP